MQAHQDSMQRLRVSGWIVRPLTSGRRRDHKEDDQRRIRPLLRLSTSILHIPERSVNSSPKLTPARRFRDFINFSAYLDVRPNDDIVDILGFLAFEMVRSLCVTALEVREQAEKITPAMTARNNAAASPSKRKATLTGDSPSKRARLDDGLSDTPTPGGEEARRQAPAQSLFAPPPSARQPLLPTHILEAFALIQRKQTASRVGGMQNWRGGVSRSRVALV